MVTLALPSLGRDLGLSVENSRWIVLAFLVSTGTLMLPAGRAGDLIGHRRIYLLGFVLFGLTSLACGLAVGFVDLVVFRLIQGAGGAMIMATAPALLTTSFPPQQRGRALGLAASATYIGLTFGPTLGGLIVSSLGWRWIFLFNVPISVLVTAMGWSLLPRGVPASKGPFGGLALFRSRTFSATVLAAMATYVTLFIGILLLPFYLEEGLGLSPVETGMLLSVQPLVMALVTTPAGWLSDRIGSRGLATLGMVLLAAGMFGLSQLTAVQSISTVAFWLVLCGLGMGVFISPNTSALMGAAPAGQQGVAGSVMAEARVLGQVLGVAAATTVFAALGGTTGKVWSAVEFDAMQVAFWLGCAVALLGAFSASLQRAKTT